jgi:hypothetical protein
MEQILEEKPIIECVTTIAIKSKSADAQEEKINLVPFGIEDNVSLTDSNRNNLYFNSNISPIHENLSNPTREEFLSAKLLDLSNVYCELKFDNPQGVISAFNILNICAQNKKFNISVSKSNENEILIYSQIGGVYNNLLIDNDGDIQYIKIGRKLGEEDSRVFPQNENLNYSYISSLI